MTWKSAIEIKSLLLLLLLSMCDCWHCPQGVRSSGGSGVCCDCWHCPQGVRSSGGSGVC